MRASLAEEVRAFLLEHGPRTASDVAVGVCARRSDVDEILAGDGFRRVQRPPGERRGSTRATFFGVSRRVPSRADRMLRVLRDGKRHTRAEIFGATGGFFLTNNAAAELRQQGHDVRHAREGLIDVYWLVRGTERAAA